jgi:hypothetical protein
VLERLIRTTAVVASLLVVAGWGLFAIDEARTASDQTAEEIAGERAAVSPDPPPEQEQARELAHSGPRELVDDVNDVLLSPFASLADQATSRWVRRSVPALVGLLVWGLGLGFLARYAGAR